MKIVATAILVVLFLAPSVRSQSPQPLPVSEMHKGINFVPWSRPFTSRESDKTLSRIIRPMGVNWVAVNVRCVQKTMKLPIFQCPPHFQRASDSDIAHVVRKAHSLGMRVMLRPILASEIPGEWAGDVDFGYNEAAWEMWFNSYKEFMVPLARLARQLNVDSFSIGVELDGTTRRAAQWRNLIRAIRDVYPGPLLYAANWGKENKVTWWDAVDAIGVDAYYPLTRSTTPTVSELKTAWIPIANSLERLSKRWGRPIIFAEAGYMSVAGAAREPWRVTGDWTLDLQGQADAYRALLETFWDRSWWRGIYWWGWDTNPAQGGPGDHDFTANNKPAENVIRAFYGAPPRPPVVRRSVTEDKRTQLLIYDDGLGKGWHNASWHSIVNLESREVVQSGTSAIRIEARPWGALALAHRGIDTSRYFWLEFFINVGQVTQRFLRVRFEYKPGHYGPDSGLAKRVSPWDPEYLEGGRFLPNTWQRVRIPLADLGAARATIIRLIIHDSTGRGQPPFFIDRIRLVGALP